MLRRMKVKSQEHSASTTSGISVSSSSSSSFMSSTEKSYKPAANHDFCISAVKNKRSLSDLTSESVNTSTKRTIPAESTVGEISSYFPLIIPTFVNAVPPCTQPIGKKRKTNVIAPPCSKPTLLLGTKEDVDNLNQIHCFVRRNIEVFVATKEDISAPSPGRKTALRVGQVGLRCVHCFNNDSRFRVKRAVCYPSNISRVYNCVSDMKFDHFSLCKFLPASERETFDKLKADKISNARGKGGNNTARYYKESAMKIGMFEDQDGMVSLSMVLSEKTILPMLPPITIRQISPAVSSDSSTASTSSDILAATYPDRRPLATPEDENNLNPIHCFVRKNVEVFIANECDVVAPAPGRKKRITLGQVGIRCIHCKSIAPRYRVKRSICYPPSIANLYHAVSNMKFDHYSACKGLSPTARQQFTDLKAASSGRKRRGIVFPQSTSCTASYYQKSVQKELGLIDTENGIRVHNNSFFSNGTEYSRPPSATVPPIPALAFVREAATKSVHTLLNKGILMDGMSALMLAATDCGIREQYERSKFSVAV